MPKEYFITLLSDFLNKRETTQIEPGVSWDKLMNLAKRHKVTGILYYQCKGFIPIEQQIPMEQYYAATLFNHSNCEVEQEFILQKLRASKVNCFIIKGSAVAEYYPIPALRTMSDTDIVVDDVAKTHEILMDSGYTYKIKYAAYNKRDLLFEIHNQLTYLNDVNSSEMVDFFNNYWTYVKDGKINWSFHLLFLILHLRGHFYSSGVGIRQFMDVAVVTKYNKDLDWPWIERKLKELDLWAFAQKVFDMNRRWFGIVPPMTIEHVSDEFYQEAETEICSGGVFGYRGNNARRVVAQSSNHAVLSIFRRTWGMLFVPYKDMIRMPQYEFLIGRPYLLLAAWIYRGWLTIRKFGMKKTVRSLSAPFVSKDSIKEQKEYIEKWSR